MRQWLLRGLIAGCLLVPLAGAGALLRGLLARDLWQWRWYTAFHDRGGSGFRQQVLRVELISQSIAIDHATNWQPTDAGIAFAHYSTAAGPVTRPNVRLTARSHPSGRDWFLEFPSGLLFSPALLPVAMKMDRRLRSRRQRRMIRARVCPGCGYDLRASNDRCPECGRVIELSDSSIGRRE